MAFTYLLTADRGKTRFKIGDSVEDKGPRPRGTNYSDAEIDYFLDAAGSIPGAVALAFDTLAAEWSAFALSEREGEASYDAKAVAEEYRKRAAEVRQNSGGGVVVLTREDAWTDAASEYT